MITEIAQASGELIQLVDDLLHQTQTRRLDAATAQASDDVQKFKDDLLARRLESVNLRLAGLQHGILVHLTDAEAEQLHAVTPNLDGFALLGLTPGAGPRTLPPTAVKSFAIPRAPCREARSETHSAVAHTRPQENLKR